MNSGRKLLRKLKASGSCSIALRTEDQRAEATDRLLVIGVAGIGANDDTLIAKCFFDDRGIGHAMLL